MNVIDFQIGLSICQRYWDEPTGHHLGADHDIIYLYATDKPMSNVDILTMHGLGFFQDTEEYSQEESWRCCV